MPSKFPCFSPKINLNVILLVLALMVSLHLLLICALTDVIPSSSLPHSTQPEEIPQSTLEPTCMNVEVVDDTMRDLDPFSPAAKALLLYPQPLIV